jgi:alpha-beta hydrolase superfamily lysophospholipase
MHCGAERPIRHRIAVERFGQCLERQGDTNRSRILTMPQAHPFFFGPAQRPLFGWLHQPGEERHRDAGLLICSPLGYDAISSHRTQRHLAEASAGHGFPALRFDYDGSGDSSGQDTDPARVDAWLESIRVAAATLRAQTGVSHVYLFGIRLGASLALLAAQRLPDVIGVILVNPVVEGRRYLRELRALAATSIMSATGAAYGGQDVQEAAGFITTADTRQAIGALRLAGDSLLSAPPRVLLVERSDLPVDNSLSDRLRQLGCDVRRSPFASYPDMLRDAHETVVPYGMIQDVLSWMADSTAGFVPASPIARLPANSEFNWPAGDRSRMVREEAIRFGFAGTIFGILTAPADTAMTGQPVVFLLNAGAVHHVGPNRLHVRIARMLASRDVMTLRLDLPGLGDSPVEAGREENQSYPDWAMVAVSQAVEYVRCRFPDSRIHSAGICSGAYHSLKAAAANMPLRSIVVINPLTFFWKPGMSLTAPAYQDTAEVMRYKRTALSVTSVRKLLTGKVDLRHLAGTLGRYTIRHVHQAARAAGRRLGFSLQDDLVAELRQVADRGTKVHFVFSTTDPGYALLRQQAAAEVRRLQRSGALTVDFVEQSDHTFTPRAAQEVLLSLLGRIFAAPPEPRS